MKNTVLKNAIIKVIGLAGVAAFSSYLQAASFDCAKATTNVEKMICQSSLLSRSDEELAMAYKNAMDAVIDKETLQQQQRTWLKDTRNKCQDIYCLSTAYRNQETLLLQAEIQVKEVAGKVGKYIWVGDALNGIGDLVSKAEDKPLCQEFRKNLNSFPSINPMLCELKLNAELGFTALAWKPLDIKNHENIIRDIARYNSRYNAFGLRKINDDLQWKEIFESVKKYRVLNYITLDVNGDGKQENLLHYYNHEDDVKNCDVYQRVGSGRNYGKYYIADLEFKNIITLSGRKEAPKDFQHPHSGDLFNYKNDLYFVTMDGKRLSKENNQFYSELRLSKVPSPHNAMGADEKCVYHFVWP
jgi:uncharacterized protein